MTLVMDAQEQRTETAHIIIADDQASTLGSLRQALAAALGEICVREAGDLASLGTALATGSSPDLILLDPAIPGVGGLSGLLYLRRQHPDVPVIIVSETADPAVMRRCVEVGAAGFIPKRTEPSVMRDAIRMVLDGEIWTPPTSDSSETADPAVTDTMRRLAHLTPQQLRVLMMLTQGLLNKQIAYALNVSEATVKAHVSAILQKLAVESRTEAVLAVTAVENGCFPHKAKVRTH